MNCHKKHLEGDRKEPDELICYGSQRSLFLRKENLDIHFQNKYLNTTLLQSYSKIFDLLQELIEWSCKLLRSTPTVPTPSIDLRNQIGSFKSNT